MKGVSRCTATFCCFDSPVARYDVASRLTFQLLRVSARIASQTLGPEACGFVSYQLGPYSYTIACYSSVVTDSVSSAELSARDLYQMM